MPKYDYYINCQMLMPPLDEKFPYTAFVEYMYEDSGSDRKRIDKDFGETQGVTWEDAEERMRKKVEVWIAEKSDEGRHHGQRNNYA
ncbi:MAG: hypothetical protein ACYS3S_18540 [Planctomycetota bacterium]|jgi:hypothetical protein